MASPSKQEICRFCRKSSAVNDVCGPIYYFENEGEKTIAAHHKCMQYSALLVQYKFPEFGGFHQPEVRREALRAAKLSCQLCKSKKINGRPVPRHFVRGASAGCAYHRCSKTFHYYCARQDPEVITKRIEQKSKGKLVVLYRVFCNEDHRQKYESRMKADLLKFDESSEEEIESGTYVPKKAKRVSPKPYVFTKRIHDDDRPDSTDEDSTKARSVADTEDSNQNRRSAQSRFSVPKQDTFVPRSRHLETDSTESEIHEDKCHMCKRHGVVLKCDTCVRVYHLKCLSPPVTSVPNDVWFCPLCLERFENSKHASLTKDKRKAAPDGDKILDAFANLTKPRKRRSNHAHQENRNGNSNIVQASGSTTPTRKCSIKIERLSPSSTPESVSPKAMTKTTKTVTSQKKGDLIGDSILDSNTDVDETEMPVLFQRALPESNKGQVSSTSSDSDASSNEVPMLLPEIIKKSPKKEIVISDVRTLLQEKVGVKPLKSSEEYSYASYSELETMNMSQNVGDKENSQQTQSPPRILGSLQLIGYTQPSTRSLSRQQSDAASSDSDIFSSYLQRPKLNKSRSDQSLRRSKRRNGSNSSSLKSHDSGKSVNKGIEYTNDFDLSLPLQDLESDSDAICPSDRQNQFETQLANTNNPSNGAQRIVPESQNGLLEKTAESAKLDELADSLHLNISNVFDEKVKSKQQLKSSKLKTGRTVKGLEEQLLRRGLKRNFKGEFISHKKAANEEAQEPYKKKIKRSAAGIIASSSKDSGLEDDVISARQPSNHNAAGNQVAVTVDSVLPTGSNDHIPRPLNIQGRVLCFAEDSTLLDKERLVEFAKKTYSVPAYNIHMWQELCGHSRAASLDREHMICFMRLIANSVRHDVTKLPTLFFQPVEAIKTQHKNEVETHTRHDSENRSDCNASLLNLIREELDAAESQRNTDVGRILYLHSMRCHVMFVYICDVTDPDYQVREILERKEKTFEMIEVNSINDFTLRDFLSNGHAHKSCTEEEGDFQAEYNECDFLFRWLMTRVPRPRLVSRPKDAFVLDAKANPEMEQLRKLVSEKSDDSSRAQVVVSVGPLNRAIISPAPYLRECLKATIDEQVVTSQSPIYVICDVKDMDMASVAGILRDLAENVKVTAIRGHPFKVKHVTCLVLHLSA